MRAKKVLPEKLEIEKKSGNRGYETFLTLHNDDVHTFDYVIETLMDVCEHDMIQAEQCAYIVHYKGKCEVKKGPEDHLTPMKNRLVNKGLLATID